MLYPIKMCCDICLFSDYTQLLMARVEPGEQDVYLDVKCPKCGHTGVISFQSLVRDALKANPPPRRE